MSECMNTKGAKQAVMIKLELKTNSLRKIINTFEQQLRNEKEFHVLAQYVFFMSSNRRNALF